MTKPIRLLGLMSLLAILAAPRPAGAQTTYNWNLGTGVWFNGSLGWTNSGNPVTWNNNLSLNAIFGGGDGTITLLSDVTAYGLGFNTNYTLNGGIITLADPQSVGGTVGVINVTDAITATINSTVAGGVGLVKQGNGTLILSGSNIYSGTTNISSGALRTNNSAALGTSSVLIQSNATLQINHSGTMANAITVAGANPNLYTFGVTPTLTGNINGDNIAGTWNLTSNRGTDGNHNLVFNGNAIALGNKSLAISGSGVNNEADSDNSRTTFQNVTFSTSSNVSLGRGALHVQGTTSMNIGGQLHSNSDWARLVMQPGTSVTAVGGIDLTANSVVASSLILNGGTLATPFIKANNYFGQSRVVFNGVSISPTQTTADFLQVRADDGSNFHNGVAELGAGGLTMNTGAFTVGINVSLIDSLGASGGITKNGTGLLYLSNPSIFSGTVDIKSGTILIHDGNALGVGGFSGTALTYVRNGATLMIDRDITIGEHLHIDGPGANNQGAIRNADGNNTLTAPIALENTGSPVIHTVDGTTLTISGQLYNGTNGFIKNGLGTLILGSSNVYGGTTTINAGTLQLTNSAGLGSGSVQIGTDSVLALKFSGTMSNPISLIGSGPELYTFGVTPTLTGNVADDGTTGTWFLNSRYSSDGAHTLTFNGNTIALGSKLLAITGNGVTSESDSNNSRTLLNNVTLTSTSAVRVSHGTLQISGNTNMTVGSLQSGNANYGRFIMGPGTSVTAANGVNMTTFGIDTSSLYLNGGALTTPSIIGNNYTNRAHTVFDGVTIVASQGNADFLQIQANGNGDFHSGAAVIDDGGLTVNTNGFTIGFLAPLKDAGASIGSLTKTGAGSLILAAANTYSGPTEINGGILRIQNPTALGVGGFSGTALTNVLSGGTLSIDGSFTIGEHLHIEGSGAGNLGALRSVSGDSTLTAPVALFDNSGSPVITTLDATSLTIAGQLYDGTANGNAGLFKNGLGSLILGGSNAFGGTTIIAAGTVQIANPAALGTSSLQIDSNSTLAINHSGTTVNAMTVTGTAPAIYTFGVTPTLAGNITADATAGTLFITSNRGTDGTHNLTFSGNSIALGPKAFSITGNGVDSEFDSENSKTTLNNVTLTTSSDVRVGRGTLQIQGTTDMTIGGQLQSGAVGDWARFIMGPGTRVTATGGVDMTANNVVASSLYLNGGTLTTPSIIGNYYAGVTHTVFNGVTVVATQNNSDFLQMRADATGTFHSGPGEFGPGGLTLDTNGFSIGIQVALKDLPGFSGGLAKAGAGALSLTTANTYSGVTNINDGILRITHGAALGVGGFSGNTLTNVRNGGTLTIDGSLNIAEHFRIEGAGASGVGAIRVISGDSTLTSPFALVNNGSGPVYINTLAGASLTIAAPIYVDTGMTAGLHKFGRGELVLAAANTYNGFTIIDEGKIQLGATNALPGASTLRLAGGTLSTGATTGFSNVTGPLSIYGVGSIELGTGSHTLRFAGFDPTNFDGLTITGWAGTEGASGTAGRIVFTIASNLTPDVLASIHFDGYVPGAIVISGNELVPLSPVPEPATALGIGSLALGVFAAYRKHRRSRSPDRTEDGLS